MYKESELSGSANQGERTPLVIIDLESIGRVEDGRFVAGDAEMVEGIYAQLESRGISRLMVHDHEIEGSEKVAVLEGVSDLDADVHDLPDQGDGEHVMIVSNRQIAMRMRQAVRIVPGHDHVTTMEGIFEILDAFGEDETFAGGFAALHGDRQETIFNRHEYGVLARMRYAGENMDYPVIDDIRVPGSY